MSKTIRVDQEVSDELYRRRGIRERNHNGVIRRALADSDPTYRAWVNEERTLLVTVWSNGLATVATRETPAHIWGPPVYCNEES